MPKLDRKSTRLNSSHLGTSYAVFCLKKKMSSMASRLRPVPVRLLPLMRMTARGGGVIRARTSCSFFLMIRRPPGSTLFPYPTLFRSMSTHIGSPFSASPRTSLDAWWRSPVLRSEEHTSELQSLRHLGCGLLLEKKKTITLPCHSCHACTASCPRDPGGIGT